MDYNSRFLDSREKTLDSKIKDIYAKARRELESSLATFVAKKERKSKEMKALVDDGRIGEDEYKEWLKRQVFQEQQWKQKVDHCTRMMSESNEKALAIIRGEQYNVYTEGANHQAYEVEKRAQFQPDISFEIYDMQTVEKMITEEPELLPPKRLNKTKDRAWNQDIIANCVTQGIIQGESIDKIAARIARETQRQNDASMVRYARTALTAAQNAGRIDTMKRTAETGVKVKKRWLATLDRRTRHSHQMLDGQEQDIDRPFMSIFGKIMYPGDPEAHPGDVYNCRCTLEYVYPDFADLAENVERYDQEAGEVIDDMTYSEWKEWRKAKPKKPVVLGAKTQAVIDDLKMFHIDALPVERFEKQPTESTIIERLCGGDMTKGSCASLSMAYAGNKAGYSVLDFRDGASRVYFSNRMHEKAIAEMEGVKSVTITGKNDVKAATDLMKQMEEGKEYILITGCHSSVVRLKDGKQQYLELQSSSSNGWHDFTDGTLKWRFGCKKSHTFYGTKYEVDNLLIDVETLGKNEGFKDVLSYINTEEGKQKKGRLGHER